MNSSGDILYLDMIGGIAGDMFIAAICDLDPSLEGLCHETVAAISGLPDDVRIEFSEFSSTGRFGRRFSVARKQAANHATPHAHVSYREAVEIIEASGLAPAVSERAHDIFRRLAEAEGAVHGVPADEVVFHEVGGWDSVIDVVLAATIIDKLGSLKWQCSSIPVGSGSVHCAHGILPVPAPAVLNLIHGLEIRQDGYSGERITPTGAAILRHLDPVQTNREAKSRLLASGSGFGSKTIDNLANVLRAYRLSQTGHDSATIAAVEFDIDDQTPEDLALALSSLRDEPGVLDVSQTPTIGKKGRMSVLVRLLVQPDRLDDIIELCLSATTTIGLRYHFLERVVLNRKMTQHSHEGRRIAVKTVRRPDGRISSKVENSDLSNLGNKYAMRKTLRETLEAKAIEEEEADGGSNS